MEHLHTLARYRICWITYGSKRWFAAGQYQMVDLPDVFKKHGQSPRNPSTVLQRRPAYSGHAILHFGHFQKKVLQCKQMIPPNKNAVFLTQHFDDLSYCLYMLGIDPFGYFRVCNR